MSKLTNPYTINGDESTLVLQSNLGVADYKYIQSLVLRQGVLDRTAAILWQKLCRRCREAGFTDFLSEEKFTNYVNNLELPTVASVLEPTTHTDDKPKRSRRTIKGPMPETVG